MNNCQFFLHQFKKDWRINCRNKQSLINAALFFLMVIVFFPLSLPANPFLIKQIAPGLIWITLFFSQLLTAERLFKQDYQDGLIEQWLTGHAPLTIIVLAKLCVHWVLTVLPLLLYCPIIAFLFNFSALEIVVLALSLILASPALLGLTALIAAASTNLQQQGVYMALLLLPLSVPVMIFGSGSLLLAAQQMWPLANLALLLAFSITALSSLPFAIAAVIRISLAD